MSKRLLTPREVATLCGIEIDTIHKMCREGMLGTRHEGGWLIDPLDARALRIQGEHPRRCRLNPDMLLAVRNLMELGWSDTKMAATLGVKREDLRRYKSRIIVEDYVGKECEKDRRVKNRIARQQRRHERHLRAQIYAKRRGEQGPTIRPPRPQTESVREPSQGQRPVQVDTPPCTCDQVQ